MGSVIRFVAVATSAVILLGFGLFAVDEIDRGSKTQQQALADELSSTQSDPGAIAPAPADEQAREQQHSSAREAVDDANDVLLGPFVDLIDSDSAWVNHGVPTLFGLLLYGVGLGFLANMLPRQRAHGQDWRAA
jgi:hypothetical protein